MAAPTETYIDPADGAAAGNDHGGAGFIDGTFNSGAPNQLTKIGAFTAATCQAGDKIYLDDNGSGEVTAGLYTISARDDNDNVTLTADIRSGGPEPTDVRCDQHTGVVGLPWATVQHALDFTTRDAANGDRFNVKAGTDDVLAAILDFSIYGVPDGGAPWICQGYTNAAGDGGIGGISGGGAVGVIDGGAIDFLVFIDMHLHNTGANAIIHADNNCVFINCEINNANADGIEVDNTCAVIDCHIHDIASVGVEVSGGSIVAFCAFENGTKDFTSVIRLSGQGSTAILNVVDIDGSSDGIIVEGDNCTAAFNSVYSSSGTGEGIRVAATGAGVYVFNNITEGFSGVGGVGIELQANSKLYLFGFNAFYNNTTNTDESGDIIIDLTANDIELAGAGNSPFIDAANDDFRVKPSVQALGYPTADYPSLAVRSYLDIGALQRMSQMLTHPGMAGGTRG